MVEIECDEKGKIPDNVFPAIKPAPKVTGFLGGKQPTPLSRAEVESTYRNDPNGLVDRILQLMGLNPSASSRNALYAYSQASQWWERNDLIPLALMMPDINVA